MAGDGERREEPPAILMDPPLTPPQELLTEVESNSQLHTGNMGTVTVAKDVNEDGTGEDLQPGRNHSDHGGIQVESAPPTVVVAPSSNGTIFSPPISTAHKGNSQ